MADRLREGCRERADLLGRFEAVSHNVAAHNVYPVSGEEIERILEGLEKSFRGHADDETSAVGDLVEAATGGTDANVAAARMAIEAERAPTRTHTAIVNHPRSVLLKWFHRTRDRFHDWSDTHWGWSDPRAARRSPRAEQADVLKNQAFSSSPSVGNLLAAYDETVGATVAELASARTDLDRAEAAHRLSAAITVHDSVLGGVLCPLLEGVPGGEPVAARLHEGCRHRAELQQAWNALTKRVPADDLYRVPRPRRRGSSSP